MAVEKLKPKEVKTIKDFEAFIVQPENIGRRFELINGRAIEKMPTQLHGLIALFLGYLFWSYRERNPIGWFFADARYQMPNDAENARIPDISFIRKERGPVIEEGPAPYMPDLAIEIQSPDDDPKEMREKAAYYLANGSRMVWLIFTRKRNRRIEVYRPGQPMLTLSMDDTLNGSDVLPGFEVAVKALYEQHQG